VSNKVMPSFDSRRTPQQGLSASTGSVVEALRRRGLMFLAPYPIARNPRTTPDRAGRREPLRAGHVFLISAGSAIERMQAFDSAQNRRTLDFGSRPRADGRVTPGLQAR